MAVPLLLSCRGNFRVFNIESEVKPNVSVGTEETERSQMSRREFLILTKRISGDERFRELFTLLHKVYKDGKGDDAKVELIAIDSANPGGGNPGGGNP